MAPHAIEIKDPAGTNKVVLAPKHTVIHTPEPLGLLKKTTLAALKVPDSDTVTSIRNGPGGGSVQGTVPNSALINPVIPFIEGYISPLFMDIHPALTPFAKVKVKIPDVDWLLKRLQDVLVSVVMPGPGIWRLTIDWEHVGT